MRFDLAQQVAAPAEQVFATVSDFDALVAQLAGGKMQFDPVPGDPGRWNLALHAAGADRAGQVWLADLTPGSDYRLDGLIDGIALEIAVAVTPLGDDRCDLGVTITLAAKSLKSRILLTSLRVIETPIAHRLEARMDTLARGLEQTA